MTNSSGFVNIIKPTGMSSSDVVCRVKKILKMKKVGHLGTLDPAAAGVLPIAFGKATKFFDYFLKKDKEYVAIVKFGIETDTLDSFGKITKIENCQIDENFLANTIMKFIGKIKQIPPKYSALKINGVKACDLAREGVDFEIKPREIEIFDLKILNKLSENEYCFKVHCSAGTYIRTLFSDIAKQMNMISTTTSIIRTKSGCFLAQNAITLNELEQSLKTCSIGEIFSQMNKIEIVEPELIKKIINGVKLTKNDIQTNFQQFFIAINNKIVGLYHTKDEDIICDVFLYE